MPKGGLSKSDLDSVDISQGDEINTTTGETIREMIKNSYHCKTNDEIDYFLRRYLAS